MGKEGESKIPDIYLQEEFRPRRSILYRRFSRRQLVVDPFKRALAEMKNGAIILLAIGSVIIVGAVIETCADKGSENPQSQSRSTATCTLKVILPTSFFPHASLAVLPIGPIRWK